MARRENGVDWRNNASSEEYFETQEHPPGMRAKDERGLGLSEGDLRGGGSANEVSSVVIRMWSGELTVKGEV